MANPWFRMWAEFAHDPKVQSMSETMQRRLVMLFCYRCGNVLETFHETGKAFHETELAVSLRISQEDLQETKALFMRKGFIDSDWNIKNWNKRQFLSDSSTSRVRKHRQAKKGGNNSKNNGQENDRYSNDDETFPERPTEYRIQNTEYKEKELTSVSSKKKTPKVSLDDLSVDHIADWLSEKRASGKYTNVNEYDVLEYFKDYCRSKAKRYKDYVAAYRNAFEWDRFNKPINQHKGNNNEPAGGKRDFHGAAYEAIGRLFSEDQLEPEGGGIVDVTPRGLLPNATR